METPDAPNKDYQALPEAIKAIYTWEQYKWLSEDEKGRLVQRECEPETFE